MGKYIAHCQNEKKRSRKQKKEFRSTFPDESFLGWIFERYDDLSLPEELRPIVDEIKTIGFVNDIEDGHKLVNYYKATRQFTSDHFFSPRPYKEYEWAPFKKWKYDWRSIHHGLLIQKAIPERLTINEAEILMKRVDLLCKKAEEVAERLEKIRRLKNLVEYLAKSCKKFHFSHLAKTARLILETSPLDEAVKKLSEIVHIVECGENIVCIKKKSKIFSVWNDELWWPQWVTGSVKKVIGECKVNSAYEAILDGDELVICKKLRVETINFNKKLHYTFVGLTLDGNGKSKTVFPYVNLGEPEKRLCVIINEGKSIKGIPL